MNLDPEILARVQTWLDGSFDLETQNEIRRLLKDSPEALADAFSSDLKFGTGGLRGIMGVGTCRINRHTIRFAIQGLANHILKTPPPHCVLAGFDSRRQSDFFAKEAASVLAANGIRVILFSCLQPTPLVSFGCREKKCTAAIMITASHNPSEYNGCKVYWSDGSQIIEPMDQEIIASSNVRYASFPHPLIEMEEDQIADLYIQTLFSHQILPHQNARYGKELRIVYSSLHGTGIGLVPRALARLGFHSVQCVEEQKIPDGSFPTVSTPNPEVREALTLGIRDLLQTESDLLIVTDPDADRMGIVIPSKGEAVILTGNQIAVILLYHLASSLKTQKKLLPSAAVVTTIVTTELFQAIASSFGCPCFEVLTGFKYIAAKIREWEETGSPWQFLFGAEESCGYLFGSFVRDKDGISASCLIAEAALAMKLQGKTLLDLLFEIYQTHGVYRESQISLHYEGKKGEEQIRQLMARLRTDPPQEIAGEKVTEVIDYLSGSDHFPKSDVLQFRLDGENLEFGFLSSKSEESSDEIDPVSSKKIAEGAIFKKKQGQDRGKLPDSEGIKPKLEVKNRIVVRPSGTEPKLKIYLFTCCKHFATVQEGIETCDQRLEDLAAAFKLFLANINTSS